MLDLARDKLKQRFGFDDFRPGQAQIINAILEGKNVLAVMPTGSGKSLCYQLPALLLPGLTVVVSPLIALMRDQVQQLCEHGIAAGALHSGLSADEAYNVSRALQEHKLKLLYVAPERLTRPDMQAQLVEADARRLVVDEAHCVSQWGHDFRPEYRMLRSVSEVLQIRQIMGFTASANERTRQDIADQIYFSSPEVFLHSFDRPNLRLAMQETTNATVQINTMLERHQGESGIVYVSSRRGVEQWAQQLNRSGHWALPYHAGMEPSLRSAHQDEFLQNDGLIMIATIAFGMGIDKPDVRFVCHANLPGSIEAYYQEIGRAGRDGLPADTLTLYSEADIVLRRRQIDAGEGDAQHKREEERRLDQLIGLCMTPRCRRQTLLAAFGEASEPCGNCDICDGQHDVSDGTLLARKALSVIARLRGRFFPRYWSNILIGKMSEAVERYGHDTLPTFGVGRELSAREWDRIFHQLQACQLLVHDSEMKCTSLTQEGRRVLKGESTIDLRDFPTKTQGKMRRVLQSFDQSDLPAAPLTPTAAVARSSDGTLLEIRQTRLLNALKAHRMAMARERKIPAYVIFSDRTLIDMAQKAPKNLTEMAEIYGIGQVKLETYGKIFLEIIAREQSL